MEAEAESLPKDGMTEAMTIGEGKANRGERDRGGGNADEGDANGRHARRRRRRRRCQRKACTTWTETETAPMEGVAETETVAMVDMHDGDKDGGRWMA